MARARNIKPSIMDNEELAELDPIDRLLFIYLWMLADREGRIEDRPKRIAAQALAYDRSADVEQILGRLATAGFVKRYRIGGVAYLQILSFVKHQAPHGTEKDSVIPDENGMLTVHDRNKNGYAQGSSNLVSCSSTVMPPASEDLNNRVLTVKEPVTRNPDNSALTVNQPTLNALNPDSGFLIPDSNTPLPPKGAVVARQQAGQQAEEPPGFVRFWTAWPKSERKQARGKCCEMWRSKNCEPAVGDILTHVERKKRSNDWTKDGGAFIEAPLVYLRNQRWDGAEPAPQFAATAAAGPRPAWEGAR